MFEEHDMVISTEKIREVPIGTEGTIVHIYPKNAAYEVEFFDFETNKTISVETVLKSQIKKR